jgi:hypothetical protein
MIRRMFVLAAALALAACQPLAVRDPASPWYVPPAGSRLILHRTLTIPPNGVSVWLQAGEVLPHGGVNQFEPWCKFEHRLRVARPLEVFPDTFTVTRVERRIDLVLGMPARLAALDWSEDGQPSHVTYATRFHLGSALQPGVLRLTCGHLQDPVRNARHLTLAEIRQALGEVFTLEPAS